MSMFSFDQLFLHPELQKAIHKLGFTHPTPIQAQVLTHTLNGYDAIGRAQTGTGKTAAFLITLIQGLLSEPITTQRYRGEPRALILAPTRELAIQIEQDARQLLKYTTLRVVTLVGGIDYDKQRHMLDKGFVDIVVATPGRLLDFVDQQEVWLDQLEYLVIDEADRLLDMGFIPDVKRIVNKAPQKENRQTLMFSATFTTDILNLAQRWLFEPITVEIEPEHKTNQLINQRVLVVSNAEKYKLLKNILQESTTQKVIIFANRRDQVKKLHDQLQRDGFNTVMLSGEMSQDKRSKMLDRFKKGQCAIMIATDVAGRGIHIDQVSHVINYTLPEHSDDYVHRIGRTGRAGSSGVSISFASEDDAYALDDLERALGIKFVLERIEGFK